MHGSCPVTKGEKFSATKWVRHLCLGRRLISVPRVVYVFSFISSVPCKQAQSYACSTCADDLPATD